MPRKAMLLGRSGGDLRWSCREGDASDEHNLAPCDVRRMRDAFKARGYGEITVVDGAAGEGEIVTQLNRETRSCTGGDTFVFYFSGHTRIRRGKMQLVLGRCADQDEDDSLSVTTLIDKLEGCDASTKLVILDCCYAGEAVEGWQPEIYENLRILAATDRATPAGEVDELEGGIFTYFLHQALTNPEHWTGDGTGVADAEGVIWSDTLSRWLKGQVNVYSESRGRRFGEPLEYVGSDKQRVEICRIEPQERPGPLAAAFRLVWLRDCLNESDLSPGLVRQPFDDLLDKIQPAYGEPRPGPSAPIEGLLAYLANMGVRAANVPVALLEFVQLLADESGNGAKLRDWIDQVARELVRAGELSSAQRVALGSSRAMEAPGRSGALSLMVVPGEPDEEARTFANAGAWLDTSGTAPVCVAALDRDIGVGDIPDLIATALEDGHVAGLLQRATGGARLTLEVFLPRQLLTVDVDRWTPWTSDPDVPVPPMSYHYNLIVRPWERIARKGDLHWRQGWAQGWGPCGGCRSSNADAPDCVAWLDAPVSDYGSRLNDGQCLFILKSTPGGRADVVRPLVCGVAKLLWCGEPMSNELESCLRRKMAGRRLSELPDIVRELRVAVWEASEEHTGHLHLLWDDPGRKPPIWDDPGRGPTDGTPPPLVSPFDQFAT